MQLKQLLEELDYRLVSGSPDTDITELVYDSRKVVPGSLFVCISGTAIDAHTFVPAAVSQGAAAIVAEREVDVPEGVALVVTPSTRKALAFLSAAYFGHPAKRLITVGLTGTKGKTTTSYMLQSVLKQAGKRVGVIGTIGAVINGVHYKTANTTPESYEIQALLKKMVDEGCEYCVMEVSSQGLKMDRVEGFVFDIGVFTNFSPDHIGPNEHASLEEYLYCKSLLFKRCRHGIVNRDDERWDEVSRDGSCTRETYGLSPEADLRAEHLAYLRENGSLGIRFDLAGTMTGTVEVCTPGRFSVYNALAALAVGSRLHIPMEAMQAGLKDVHVPGRVEIVPVKEHFTILIDYAHNAASVGSLLRTLKEYEPGRLICVYGCGGNRSRLRRYDMGKLCGELADLSILTCDNPRMEEIKDINEDIKVGLKETNGRYIEIEDRAEAIHYSMDHALDGDIIVLLGKGHEDYQDIKGKKYPFSERKIIEEYAGKLENS
ncbi:UDP-N-acetylmuramoyl-L-alanyl-D-glutamate--2,6-diaminopimelate ligase [Anaerolentibacter hominis]|uniref:UDP-N-acetylmuramoyl-L-alanyl-D-glutamate--2, 6-diaminopimelate ligase n=1 Tax=Anaerolentibacter hominis TaxID=3079009 RepID=UPI0031B820A7